MSQRQPPPAPLPTRPYLLDYFLLLSGFGLSLYLMELSPMTVAPGDQITLHPLRAWIVFLPRLMRIPEGIILLFPIFFITQKIMGRKQEITSAEWLWIFAWLGTTALTGVAAMRHLPVNWPEFIETWFLPVRWLWHIGFGAALALIALVLALYGVIRRSPMPWTHGFGLVLAVWPILPLVGILLLTK